MDPAALQILISRLTGVAEEMGAVLRRAASSPNIKERADCSAALFTPDGSLLVQAEHIPVHLGSMPASVAAAIAHVGVEALQPGDQVVLNDPFAGGTHLNDITLVAPCFASGADRGALLGWAANRAHHADVGGMAPGSIPPEAVEVFQEGLRLPPVVLSPAVVDVLLANSRTPEERRGDLDAQLGANAIGVARLRELAVGVDVLDEVLAYGERRMRAALSAVPVGSWTFEDVVDSTGPAPAQQVPAVVKVTLTMSADGTVTFDFTGSSEQRPGNVNAVEAVTASCVSFALRSAVDPGLPANGGTMRPVRVVAPAGSIVNALLPAAVGAGNVEVSQRIADVCLGALAQALPGRVPAAGQGTMNNLIVGGSGSGGWVYYETVAGGQGGRPSGAAGMSGAHTGMTNIVNERHRSEGARPGQSGIPTNMTNTVEERHQFVGEPRPGQSGLHTGMTNIVNERHRSATGLPGQSGIHTNMTNTLSTPTEALERAYPMRIRRFTLRRGSGGAGLARGGEGIEREIEVLEACTVSLITERRVSQPWGLDGGEPGAVGENWLLPRGDESRAERLPDKCTIQLSSGDVVRIMTPGGGGWGAP